MDWNAAMNIVRPITVSSHQYVSDIDRQTCPGLLSDTLMYGAKVRFPGVIPVARPQRRAPAVSRLMACVAFLALLATTCAPSLYAGQGKPKKHDNRHEIEMLEDAWRTAVLKADTLALSSLLADDYIAITASGTLQTKDEALASLRTGRVRITNLAFSDRKLRFYGNTALVTSLANVQATTTDNEVTGSYRYTRVYVFEPQGKWKIVSFEASRIRNPGDHR
jgi:ketosteroid isomerase-like protein